MHSSNQASDYQAISSRQPSPPTADSVFRSRVSPGLVAFIGAVFFGPLIVDGFKGSAKSELGWVAAFLFGLFSLIVYFFVTTRYRISGRDLIIQMGWFNYSTISIDSIRSIEPSRSILSAPAPSLRRLEIKYNQWDSVLVSPCDQAGFNQCLMTINPNIQIKTPSK
jgi:hypothetical protein